MSISEDVKLGRLALEPVAADATESGLSGVAQLQGAPDGGHRDMAVPAWGTVEANRVAPLRLEDPGAKADPLDSSYGLPENSPRCNLPAQAPRCP